MSDEEVTTYEADHAIDVVCMHKNPGGGDRPTSDPTPTLVEHLFHRPATAALGRLDWLATGDSLQTWVEVIEQRMDERGLSAEVRSEIRRDPHKRSAFLTNQRSQMGQVRWVFCCDDCGFSVSIAHAKLEPALEAMRQARHARIPLHLLRP